MSVEARPPTEEEVAAYAGEARIDAVPEDLGRFIGEVAAKLEFAMLKRAQYPEARNQAGSEFDFFGLVPFGEAQGTGIAFAMVLEALGQEGLINTVRTNALAKMTADRQTGPASLPQV